MIKTGTLVCGVIFAALVLATPNVQAQFPGPPPLPSQPPSVAPPTRDTSTEVKSMTTRYGLSEDQAKSVSAILEEQKKKVDDLAKDNSLTPEQRAQRLLAIREEEIKRVSEVLTPEQRKKYEADVHPSSPPRQPTDTQSVTPPSSATN